MRDTFPRSGHEYELIAKGRWDRTPRLQKRLQMRFSCLLETQDGLTPISTMGVAAWKEIRLGDPDSVFVLAQLNFGNGHYHGPNNKACRYPGQSFGRGAERLFGRSTGRLGRDASPRLAAFEGDGIMMSVSRTRPSSRENLVCLYAQAG